MGNRPMIKVTHHVDMLSILLEYVRYGIEMQIGTHKAIRSQLIILTATHYDLKFEISKYICYIAIRCSNRPILRTLIEVE